MERKIPPTGARIGLPENRKCTLGTERGSKSSDLEASFAVLGWLKMITAEVDSRLAIQ
jgi:hypothetical protein